MAALPTPNTRRHLLVTGGAGFIGSHTVVQLLQAGHRVTILDNLSNSSRVVLQRIANLCGGVEPKLYEVDLLDVKGMQKMFEENQFDACIHFAGLKSVGESCDKPLLYYETNVVGTLNLLKLLDAYNCRRLVFSSSATVYGGAGENPLKESERLVTTNPYGQTKLVVEEMLRDVSRAPVPQGKDGWKIVILRYFNPIGAHPSGTLGEDPRGTPNNLLPFVMQVCVGKRERVQVFGGDYPTVDGTGVRDYIHVEDLAAGHLAALEHGLFGSALGAQSCDAFNLGNGVGVSVLQVIAAASKAVGKEVPYTIAPRRAGDVPEYYGDATKAHRLLHWKARYGLQQMVDDAWRWQRDNPEGFQTEKKE